MPGTLIVDGVEHHPRMGGGTAVVDVDTRRMDVDVDVVGPVVRGRVVVDEGNGAPATRPKETFAVVIFNAARCARMGLEGRCGDTTLLTMRRRGAACK